MKEDVINIEITADGLIKSTTPTISAANHSNASQFFQILARLTGGAVDIKKKDKTAEHHHHEHTKGNA